MKHDVLVTRLVFILIFVVVIAYIALSGLKTLFNPYKFITVYSDVVEKSIAIDGWLFREEETLDPALGLVSYRLDEGGKAAKGEVVAVMYTSQDALSRQQKVRELSEKIAQLDYARGDVASSGKNLESQISASLADLQRAASRGDFSNLWQQGDEYKRLVLRREYLTSPQAEEAMGLASLSFAQELASLQSASGQDAVKILAPAAGVFSSTADGYEGIFLPEELDGITVPEFKELVQEAPLGTQNAAGKVATDSVWHLAMVVEEEQLTLFRQYSQVSVRLSALAEAVPMYVEEIGYAAEGEALVILDSRKNLSETIALRHQSGTVIFQSDEGIRIPKKALRVDEKEGTGVYTVTGYQAEFKPVKVVAEDKDYYIVTPSPKDTKDKRVLRTGDDVIITAADLYQGKVVR